MADSKALTTPAQALRRLWTEGTLAGLTDAELLNRFTSRRDEAAFAALVARHGPMVRATCQGVTGDPHLAEDAAQATFLALALRAESLWSQGASLAGWLHRVAHRTASKAVAEAARHRTAEQRAASARTEATQSPPDIDQAALRAAVHHEVAQLPTKYRLPVVLCDLSGQTYAQAAAELGQGEATIRRRRDRALELLRSRLARKGISPAILPLTALLGPSTTKTIVGPTASELARAAGAVALAGRSALTATAVTPTAIALARSVLQAGTAARITGAAAVLLTVGLTAGLAWGFGPAAEPDSEARQPMAITAFTSTPPLAPQPNPKTEEEPEDEAPKNQNQVVIKGRVVDADGDPVAGAFVTDQRGLSLHADLQPEPVTTDANGQFTWKMPRVLFEERIRQIEPGAPVPIGALYAWADDHAPSFAEVTATTDGPKPAEIQLAPNDATIEGRIVDLEGQPVAGAEVRASRVSAPPEGEDLSTWLEPIRRETGETSDLPTIWKINGQLLDLPMQSLVSTDGNGQFQLDSIGRNRVVRLTISGPSIASDEVYAITADVPSFRVVCEDKLRGQQIFTYYGSEFEHAAAPSKPVVGTVRDAETGKPVEGAWIGGNLVSAREGFPRTGVETTSDADGHYRLSGLPPIEETDRFRLFVRPPSDSPYPNAHFATRADTPALDPVRFDIELSRGVVVHGRVFDKKTGKPVPARVNYFALEDNPHLEDYPGFNSGTERPWAKTDADGRFTIVALPGPGLIAARSEVKGYLPRFGAPEIVVMEEEKGNEFRTVPRTFLSVNYQSIASIDPHPDTSSIEHDLPLDPGRSITGQVVGPEGKPLSGVEARGLDASDYGGPRPLPGSEFEVRGVSPHNRRTVFFIHRERQLAGSLPLLGDETGPATVQLEPWGVITGRVVDGDGNPVTNISIDDHYWNADPTQSDPPPGLFMQGRVLVDNNGRFRIEGLVPGLAYQAGALKDDFLSLGSLFQNVTVEPGATKDLGAIVIEEEQE